MSKAIDKLMEAMKFAERNRPRVGGFPYLAPSHTWQKFCEKLV
jgi:hypothetical protein